MNEIDFRAIHSKSFANGLILFPYDASANVNYFQHKSEKIEANYIVPSFSLGR